MFVIDARAGLTPNDRAFADFARRANKPVVLVANKSEGRHGEVGAMESYALGLGDPIQISAEHGEGLSDLYDALRVLMPEPVEEGEEFDDDDIIESDEELAQRPIRVAIVGRPNAGKSTLINHLLGEERLLTSAEAGTTRDSISVEITWQGREFRVFDTAGLRRRSRIEEKLEKLSVADALRAVRFAEVVVMMMDAQNRFEEQDLRIADLIEREGRAIVLAVNKWDLMERKGNLISALRTDADHWLPQVKGVPVVAVSGLMGEGIDRLMTAIQEAYAVWNKRVPTATLNRWFEQAVDANPPPAVSGRRLKLNYITQAKARPPSFVLFCSRADAVPQSYLRYLTNSHARGLRPAGHADPDHAARKGQSVRPQAQAAVMSEQASARCCRRQAAGAQRRGGLHLRHHPARHARARPDHADPAQAGGKLCRQRHGDGGADLRPVRHRLGADAVPVLADPRRAVGPLRPAAGGAAVEFRAGAGLCADGAGAVADLAVHRPGDLGHHLGEHLDRLCLYRRRDAAGTARRGVRQDRRGLRRRLHSRARASAACSAAWIRACRSGSRRA